MAIMEWTYCNKCFCEHAMGMCFDRLVTPTKIEIGHKADNGKPQVVQGVIQYFPRALKSVARVSEYGAHKYNVPYSDKNWERVEDGLNRYTDALGRHLCDEMAGDESDPESGLLHAAHAAWNALARLELILRKKDGL